MPHLSTSGRASSAGQQGFSCDRWPCFWGLHKSPLSLFGSSSPILSQRNWIRHNGSSKNTWKGCKDKANNWGRSKEAWKIVAWIVICVIQVTVGTQMYKFCIDWVLFAGDVYRRDSIDTSHYPIFHQMEGIFRSCIVSTQILWGTRVLDVHWVQLPTSSKSNNYVDILQACMSTSQANGRRKICLALSWQTETWKMF